jgi:hypothetical protein
MRPPATPSIFLKLLKLVAKSSVSYPLPQRSGEMGKLLRYAQDPLLRHVAEPSVVPEAPSFALAVQICCQVFRCWGACLSRAPLTVGILQCGELLEDASRGSTVHEDTASTMLYDRKVST